MHFSYSPSYASLILSRSESSAFKTVSSSHHFCESLPVSVTAKVPAWAKRAPTIVLFQRCDEIKAMEINNGGEVVTAREGSPASSNSAKDQGPMKLPETKETGQKAKKISCSVCMATFTTRSHLRLHARKHTGDRPFHCSFCPKTFTRKGMIA